MGNKNCEMRRKSYMRIRNYIFAIGMTSFCTFVTACGASGAEISTTPDVVFFSETKNVEIHDESPDITDESIEIDTDNDNEKRICENIESMNATAFYADYYLNSKYMIICEDKLCSVLMMDDFEQVKEISYSNVARIDYSVVEELGFVKIVDKTGEEESFVFGKDDMEKIQEEISACMYSN